MNRDELRIRELEKEIVETDACIAEMRAKFRRLPATDRARVITGALIGRLMEARAGSCQTLSALVGDVELRLVRH